MSDRSATLLAALAATGLPCQPIPGLPGGPLADDEWAELIARTDMERLTGLLGRAVSTGRMPASPDQIALLEDHLRSWHTSGLRLERLLIDLVTSLEARGITHRVFKGPALAHVVYPDPAMRVFGDLDIAVPSAAFGAAKTAIVEDLAAEPPWPELRPGFDERFGKEALLSVGRAAVDLHRTLVSGPFGLRIPEGELFVDTTTFGLGGRTLATFGPVTTFLQACINAALGDVPPRWMSVRDVAQVQVALRPETEAILARAEHWGVSAVVQRAVRLAEDAFPGVGDAALAGWAHRYRTSKLDGCLLRASTASGRGYTRQLANLAVIPGVRPRAAYLRAIVSPQPSYLEARGWTRWHHVSRAVDHLRP